MFFTERLALLLETGNDLHTSLEILERQVNNPGFGELMNGLRTDIAGGLAFSQALAKHPEVFSSTHVNLVGASEQGGFMGQALQRLTEMEEKSAQLRATIGTAMFYPVFLIVFSIAVVVFVLMVVFPKFQDLFTAIADQLPMTTIILMAASDLLRQYWTLILGGVGMLLFVLSRWLGTPNGTATLDRLKLTVPLVKDIFVQLYLSQLMRVMGLSLGHGVSVLDTLRACREVVRNSEFRRLIDGVEAEVNEGRGIAAGFRKAGFIPPLARQMIETGEDTGNLPLVMGRIADFYERELTKKLITVSKLVEPVMLLLMGVVVGLIVSSLILPIFKLSRAVH